VAHNLWSRNTNESDETSIPIINRTLGPKAALVTEKTHTLYIYIWASGARGP